MVMRTRVPRIEPSTAPMTTPVLDEPEEEEARGRVTCPVCVGAGPTGVVRKVDAAALKKQSVNKSSFWHS